MRDRLALALVLAVILTSASASAQSRGELFLGFSGRTGGDPVLKGWNLSGAARIVDQLQIVVDLSGQYESRDVRSQNGTVTFSNLQNFLQGIPATVAPGPPIHTGRDIHSAMAGPQFSQRIGSRVRVFGRALFGATRIHARQGTNSPVLSFVVGPATPGVGIVPASQAVFTGTCVSASIINSPPNILPGPNVNPLATCVSDTRTGFSFGAGGGLDVSVSKHWAVRVFQGDYVNQPSVLGRGTNEFRLSSGLVWQ